MPRRDALEEAWRIYRTHPGPVLRVTALSYGGIVFLSAVFFATIGPFGLIPAAYVWIASVYWLQAPLARLVEDLRAGAAWRGARKTLESVYPQLGRVTGASALASLAVFATINMFPPLGLYLMTRWALLVPVVAVENCGLFTAFSRSNEIVRGHAWGVFGRIALSVAILIGAWIAIGILTALAVIFVDGWWGILVFAAIALGVLALTTPVIALSWTMLYYALRDEVPLEVLEERRLRGGRTLDRAWEAYKARPGRVIVLALPVSLALSAAQILLAQIQGLLVVPATLIAYVWLEGVIAAGLGGLDTGTMREWLRDTWAALAARLSALLVAGVLGGIVLMLTLPFVIGVRFIVAGAAAVVDRASGFGSLRRSSRLVKGQSRRAWKVLFVTSLAVPVVLTSLALLAFDLPLAAYAVVVAANVLTAPYVGLAWALMHRALVSVSTAARVDSTARPALTSASEAHMGASPTEPPPYYAQPQQAVQAQPVRTNGFAIASLVLGIVWIYWIGSILALVFGYIGKSQIDSSGGAQTGRGMAIAGIVLGWIGVGILILVIVIAVGVELSGDELSLGLRGRHRP